MDSGTRGLLPDFDPREPVDYELFGAYDGSVPRPGYWPMVDDRIWALWHVRCGQAEVRHDGGRLALRVGDWVVLPPGLRRSQRFSDDARLLSLRFVATWAGGRPLLGGPLPLVDRGDGWGLVEATAVALVAVVGGQGWWRRPVSVAQRWRRDAALAGFLAVWYHRMIALGCSAREPAPRDARLARVLEVLAEYSGAGPVPYPALVASSGLSRPHIDRLFKREMGCSPHRWCERQCLAQAESLLRDDDRPIKAIAAALGFADASHFATWFRRLTGVSPRSRRRDGGVPV